MNIFALSPDPILSARAHCDQHLHKMILESAQIASTVLDTWGFCSTWLYKPTHQKHSCTIWASYQHNLIWMLELASELENIRQELGYPYHASTQIIKYAQDLLAEEFPSASSALAHEPYLAMPIQIKMLPNLSPQEKYQEYYRQKNKNWTLLDKRPMTWKNRPVPSFMNIIS